MSSVISEKVLVAGGWSATGGSDGVGMPGVGMPNTSPSKVVVAAFEELLFYYSLVAEFSTSARLSKKEIMSWPSKKLSRFGGRTMSCPSTFPS